VHTTGTGLFKTLGLHCSPPHVQHGDGMTMPNERREAVERTQKFLIDLLNPTVTPRVPREIRDRAYTCLKHYPREYDMELAREDSPRIFGEWDD
jgi:hypothetical protein